MANIGFIGLDNMGGPMVANLIKGGHAVRAFDRVAKANARAGEHARSVYLEDDKVMDAAETGSLLIDCSTIDIETARAMIGAAETRGFGACGR